MAKKKPSKSQDSVIADQLRQAIRDSGMSMYAVSLATGHRPDIVTRFMQGRDSQISTCEKMANAIGYELVLKRIKKG